MIFLILFLLGSAQRGHLAKLPRTKVAEPPLVERKLRRAEFIARQAGSDASDAQQHRPITKTRIQTSRYVAQVQRVVAATSRVYSVTSERPPTRTGIGCQVTQ